MLGDAAGFACDHVGRAQGVEQRGLAVVDMAHDRDDRRTWLQRGGIIRFAFKTDLDIGFGNAAHRVAEFFRDQFGCVSVDYIVAAQHFALVDHEFHDVSDALVHAACKVLQGNGFRQGHFDRDLFALVTATEATFAFAFAGTLERGERALAICIVAEGGRDGELAATAFAAVAGGTGGGFARAIAIILADLAALAATGRFFCGRIGQGRCCYVRLGAATCRAFARHGCSRRVRSSFGFGLAGFLLGAAADFGLVAFAGFCRLALLFGAEAILAFDNGLVFLGAVGFFSLAVKQHFLACLELVDRDAKLAGGCDETRLERVRLLGRCFT